MDLSSVLGLAIGILTIIGFQIVDSGSIMAILQPGAAIVVLGGTFGAMFLNFSTPAIKSAFEAAKGIFFDREDETFMIVDQITQLAHISRKNGVLFLENVIDRIDDKFLQRGTRLAIDINDPQLLHEILTTEVKLDEEQELMNSRVFEAIGGYAPTFGIVGAVLGLIQVMGHIQNPAQLGEGIATAFVATLYGVGLANLVFLPIAGKLKMRIREKVLLKEMIVQGLISIQMNENPAIIEEKLITFLNFTRRNADYAGSYAAIEG